MGLGLKVFLLKNLFSDWGWKEPGLEILSCETKDNQSSIIVMSESAVNLRRCRPQEGLSPSQVGGHSSPQTTETPCEIHSKC